jgi:hypothetical protein
MFYETVGMDEKRNRRTFKTALHAANYFPMKVAAFYAHAVSVISVARATCAISSSLIRLSLCLFNGTNYEPVHRCSCCLLCFDLLLKWIFKKFVDDLDSIDLAEDRDGRGVYAVMELRVP